MRTKKQTKHAAVGEIKFSDLEPASLSRDLGLTELVPSDSNELTLISPSQLFDETPLSDEDSRAFEAFKADFLPDSFPMIFSEEKSISEPSADEMANRIGLFLWALIKEIGNRSEGKRKRRLSSRFYIFKDDVCTSILEKGKELEISFEDEEFDNISSLLQRKNLIRTSEEGIRITDTFHHLFHEKLGAWLVY